MRALKWTRPSWQYNSVMLWRTSWWLSVDNDADCVSDRTTSKQVWSNSLASGRYVAVCPIRHHHHHHFIRCCRSSVQLYDAICSVVVLIAESYHKRAGYCQALQNSSVFSWRQKEDDSDRSWTDVGNEFQAVVVLLVVVVVEYCCPRTGFVVVVNLTSSSSSRLNGHSSLAVAAWLSEASHVAVTSQWRHCSLMQYFSSAIDVKNIDLQIKKIQACFFKLL